MGTPWWQTTTLPEARRNLARKAGIDAIPYLDALLLQIEVSHVQHSPKSTGPSQANTDLLLEKDRPVLLAAIALRCDTLVTGDRTDFGFGFGKTFGGVAIYPPAELARVALRL